MKDSPPRSIWGRTPCPASSSGSPAPTSCSRRRAPIPPDALGPPGLIAYLLIEAGGSLQALKAHIRPGYAEGELVATLLDPFRLGQRRNFSRAPLVLPAHLRPAGSTDDPKTTFTRDISAGGLRVAKQSSYLEADLHEVVIGLVQANREIRALAETVRVTDHRRLARASPRSRPRIACCSPS